MFKQVVTRKSLVLGAMLGVAALAAYTAVPARAQQDPGAPSSPPRLPGQQPGRGQGGAMNLEGAMKLMERSYKTIARQIDDPAKDASTLKAISQFQTGTAASKALLPHEAEKGTDEEKAAAGAEFRKMLLEVLVSSVDMEKALLAGDRDAAKASLAKIHDMEETGHKKFRPDEDH